MLGKLYLPDEVDDDKVRVLKLLLTNLRSVRCHLKEHRGSFAMLTVYTATPTAGHRGEERAGKVRCCAVEEVRASAREL